MDDVDRATLAAWNAMLERIARDPEERARRLARAARIRARPARPWCLALRAGDTRIDDWGLSWSVNDDAQHGRPHPVEITQWDLRDLTHPISLGPWPGVPISEAARLLGRDTAIITRWARTGALSAEIYDRRVFGLGGTFGGDMLSVWSPSPIDPNAHCGRPPHSAWGSLWQHLANQVPAEWKCALQRVPRRGVFGKDAARWLWVCPGRTNLSSLSSHLSPPHTCGRLVDKLYLPLPCWTIANVHGQMQQLGIPTPPWANLIGQPMACHRCWNIQSQPLTGRAGWNLFVSHITGGLLTGREVPRPPQDAPLEDRRSTRQLECKDHTTQRRQRVREMLLAGATHDEIAATFGVSLQTVASDVMRIYRAAGIPARRGSRANRWTLIRRIEWGGAAEAETLDRLARLDLPPRQMEIARLLIRGWSMREIAEELGIKPKSVAERAHQAYRRLGIHSRADLRALVGVGVGAGGVEAEAPEAEGAAGVDRRAAG